MMRLLSTNTKDPELHEFTSDEDIPPYAILSHTWEDEEMKYEEVADPSFRKKKGYQKISWCCQQAAVDEIHWIWVDTCCIDKRSSAELSEAINSMYMWYRNAVVCYAFLQDVPSLNPRLDKLGFQESRWFTRGWTLQELLAPVDVLFYSRDWVKLGSRDDLGELISVATGIERHFLIGDDLSFASAAKKMSWASNRKTSRTEDMAYCLMGIFGVNMPLLYGEGKKAFTRLQEEILRVSGDHSILAWGRPFNLMPFLSQQSRRIKESRKNNKDDSKQDDDHDSDQADDDPDQDDSECGSEPYLSADEPMFGLLASSPREFESSGDIMNVRAFENIGTPPAFFGGWVRIGLPTLTETFPDGDSTVPWLEEASVAVLGCRRARQHNSLLGLLLRRWSPRFYGRYKNPICIDVPSLLRHNPNDLLLEKLIKIVDIKAPSVQPWTDAILLNISPASEFEISLFRVLTDQQGARWDEGDRSLYFTRQQPFSTSFIFRSRQNDIAVILTKGNAGKWKQEIEMDPRFFESDIYKKMQFKNDHDLGFLIQCLPVDTDSRVLDTPAPSGSSRSLLGDSVHPSNVCWAGWEPGDWEEKFDINGQELVIEWECFNTVGAIENSFVLNITM